MWTNVINTTWEDFSLQIVNNPSKVCGLHRPCSIIYQHYKTFIYILKPWFALCPNVIIFAWPFEWDLLKHDRNWFPPYAYLHLNWTLVHECQRGHSAQKVPVSHRSNTLHTSTSSNQHAACYKQQYDKSSWIKWVTDEMTYG